MSWQPKIATIPCPHEIAWELRVSACGWLAISILTCVTCVLPLPTARGQRTESTGLETKTTAKERPEKIRIRRVFVPKDRIRDAINGPYYPVPRKEFEELLNSFKQTGESSPEEISVGEAVYTARLDKNQLVAGQASVSIVSHVESSKFLQLGASSLVIKNPHWGTPDSRPVQMGVSPDNQTTVRVDSSGTIDFQWSLKPADQTQDQELVFDLDLWTGSMTSLYLDLPFDYEPVASLATVTPCQSVSPDDHGSERRRVWLIQIQSNSRDRLVLRDMVRESIAGDRPSFRKYVTHAVTPRGITSSVEFEFDLVGKPLTVLNFTTQRQVEILSAQLDTQPLVVMESAGDETTKTVMISLPESVQQLGRSLTLKASTPLLFDEPFVLPVFDTKEMIWQEETSNIIVAAPLKLVAFDLRNCQIRASTPSLVQGQAYSFEVIHFSHNARIELEIARTPSDLKGDSVSNYSINSNRLEVKFRARLSTPHADQFTISADLTPGWSVESVQAFRVAEGSSTTDNGTPTNNLVRSWEVLPEGKRERVLWIHLTEPIAPNMPVDLSITGEHRVVLDEKTNLRWANLIFLSLDQLVEGDRLYAFASDAGYRFLWRNDSLVDRLDITSMDQKLIDLIEVDRPDLLARLDKSHANFGVSIVEQRDILFDVDIQCESTLSRGFIEEFASCECYPMDSKIDQLTVHFSQARPYEPKWLVDRNANTTIVARKVQAERRGEAGGDSSGETYVIQFQPPVDHEFTFVALRRTAWKPGMRLSTASVEKAKTLTGRLLVRHDDGSRVNVDTTGLIRLPQELENDRSNRQSIGLFRYEPTQLPSVGIEVFTADDQDAPLLVWNSGILSTIGPQESFHQVTLQMQNEGHSSLTAGIPQGCQLVQVVVEGKPLISLPNVNAQRSFTIPLPRNVKFPEVIVIVRENRSLPFFANSFAPPTLPLSVPVFRQNWTVLLPDGYSVESAHLVDAPPPGLVNALGLRLFGGLWTGIIGDRHAPWLRRAADNTSATALADLGDTTSFAEQWLALPLNDVKSLPFSDRTWFEFIDETWTAARTASPTTIRLSVDDHNMDRVGIFAESTVALDVDQHAETLGDALAAASLAVVVRPNEIVVTSFAAAKVWYSQNLLTRVDDTIFAQISSLPVSDNENIYFAARLPTLKQWANRGTLSESSGSKSELWSAEIQLADAMGVAPGHWQVADLGQSQPARSITVQNSTTILSFQMGIALIACFIGITIAGQRPWFVIWASTISAALALLAPLAYAYILSGFMLGLFAAAILRFFWRHGPSATNSTPRAGSMATNSQDSESFAVATKLLWIGLIVGMTNPATAQTLENRSPVSDPDGLTQAVVIPTDDEFKEEGDQVFVPARLYERLLGQELRSDISAADFAIQKGTYELIYNWGEVGTRLALTEVIARWEVETVQEKTRVTIPMSSSEIFLLPDRSSLDGSSADLTYDSRGITIEVQDIGTHDFEITFRPKIDRDEDDSWFSIPIPGIPDSTAVAKLPPDASHPTFTTANGASRWDADHKQLLVDIGPASLLNVRWPHARSDAVLSSPPTAQILQWLKIEFGSVVIDTRINIGNIQPNKFDEFTIGVDSNWRPDFAQQSDVERLATETLGRKNWFRFRRKSLDATSVTLDLKFSMPNTTGIGRFQLPQISFSERVDFQSHFAVSIDQELVAEADLSGESLAFLSVTRFLELWDVGTLTDPVRPDFAYLLVGSEPSWFVSTRRRIPEVEVAQTLHLDYGGDVISLRYDASITVTRGSLSVLEFAVPRGLHVTSITCTIESENRSLTYLVNDGKLTIFLSSPIDQPFTLNIDGTLGYTSQTKHDLARIVPLEAKVTSEQIELYRQAGIVVSWDSAQAGMVQNRGDIIAPHGSRHVLTLDDPAVAASKALRISARPSRPLVDCMAVTIVEQSNRVWQAQLAIDLRLRPESDPIDALCVNFSQQWLNPLPINFDAELRLSQYGMSQQNQLVIIPAEPINKSQTLWLSGRIKTQPTSIPNIEVRGFDVQQIIVLPQTAGSEPLTWQLTGLIPYRSRQINRVIAADELENRKIWRVLDDRFQATLQSNVDFSNQPQIRMIDTRVVCTSQRDFYGMSTIDLEPTGLTSCFVEVPHDVQLEQVSIEGLDVRFESSSDRRWKIPLGPFRLPQRIQLVFRGQLLVLPEIDASTRQFSVPRLLDSEGEPIPVERTLLEIGASQGLGQARSLDMGPVDDPVALEMFRLKNIAAILETSTSNAQLRDDEKRNWYESWLRRFVSSYHRLDALLTSMQSPRDKENRVLLDALLQDQKDLARRSGLNRAFDTIFANSESELTSPQPVGPLPSKSHMIRSVSTGQQPPIRIAFQEHDTAYWPQRIGLVVCLLGGTVLLVRLLHHPGFASILERFPSLLWLGAGSIWVLWLTPVWLGYLIVLVGVCGLARFAWIRSGFMDEN